MTSLAQDTPVKTGATPAPPIALRAIAAWLETHPEFDAYEIQLRRGDGDPIRVNDFGHTRSTAAEIMTAVGGEWQEGRGGVADELFKFTREIAPGIAACLFGRVAGLEDAAA